MDTEHAKRQSHFVHFFFCLRLEIAHSAIDVREISSTLKGCELSIRDNASTLFLVIRKVREDRWVMGIDCFLTGFLLAYTSLISNGKSVGFVHYLHIHYQGLFSLLFLFSPVYHLIPTGFSW